VVSSAVYSHAVHPPLPSFPPRRSSDLSFFPSPHPHPVSVNALGQGFGVAHGQSVNYGQPSAAMGLGHPPPHQQQQPQGFAPPPRSEEHTSELQSRENLVCRLLLEKKKK